MIRCCRLRYRERELSDKIFTKITYTLSFTILMAFVLYWDYIHIPVYTHKENSGLILLHFQSISNKLLINLNFKQPLKTIRCLTLTSMSHASISQALEHIGSIIRRVRFSFNFVFLVLFYNILYLISFKIRVISDEIAQSVRPSKREMRNLLDIKHLKCPICFYVLRLKCPNCKTLYA